MFQHSDSSSQSGTGSRGETSGFWEAFAQRHGGELRRCVAAATRRVGWPAEPEDLEEMVQEVYCRLLETKAPAGLAAWGTAQLWGYLHRIVRSTVIDTLRARGARKRGGCPRRQGDRPAGEGGAAALAEPRAPGPTMEERLLVREAAAALRRRVCELGGAEHGSRNLHILELAAVEGYTAAEISRRLAGALTPSSVHTVLHRLRLQVSMSPGAELLTAMGG